MKIRERDTYTPGPWAIYASSVADQAERSWMKGVTIYSEPTGKRIADTCWLNSSNDPNARLISAAPDLLASLKLVLSLYDDRAPHPTTVGTIRVDLPWVRAARFAVAKAEGGPS